MTVLQEAERLLITMSPGEKAQMFQWIVKDMGDAFPGIASHLWRIALLQKPEIPMIAAKKSKIPLE